MAEGFTKLFSSITNSTVWAEDSDTRVVWVTLLAMAERDGYIPASIPGIANMARVSIEKTKEALEKFMAPDEYSRSKEHDGRRLEEADRGFQLLNYCKFRDMRDQENRRATNRASQRAYRAREKERMATEVTEESAFLADRNQCQPRSAHAEADSDSDSDSEIAERERVARVYDAARKEDTALLVRRHYAELMGYIASFPSQGEKAAKACAALVRWANATPDPTRALNAAFLGFRDDDWAREAGYPITDLAERIAKYHVSGMAIIAEIESSRGSR